MNVQTDFEWWWWNAGSGIRPKPNHDHEEHARRVAKAAWDAARQNQKLHEPEKAR
jgi:hypothetical protein